MKLARKVVITSFVWVIVYLNIGQNVSAQIKTKRLPLEIVQKELSCINQNDRICFSNLWIRSMQKEILFLTSTKQKWNMLNIQKATFVDAKELSLQAANLYIIHLPKLISRYGRENVRVLYVAVHYDVEQQSIYQLRGTNYVLVTFVKEKGLWRIASKMIAPTDKLIQHGYGFGTKEEKTFKKRRLIVK